jgi:hypothetical protein
MVLVRAGSTLDVYQYSALKENCAMRYIPLTAICLQLICGSLLAEPLKLDQRPARPDEWGYRPAEKAEIQVTPPGFCWRPQGDIERWELECGRDNQFEDTVYRHDRIDMNVHCPDQTFDPGSYYWRYRGITADGRSTEWSKTRAFRIAANANQLPLPQRQALLDRIPDSHPRLFLRPEDLPRLREFAQGTLRDRYRQLSRQCDRWLKNPPPTAEPEKYPETMQRGSPEWKKQWWGNRVYTINALDAAATLAFTRLLDGNDEYGQLAKKILLECAEWDPKGATGYRYNDEAGMPYAYYFSRAYTFVNDLLAESEKQKCREMMKIRGDEMYQHLYPRHLWRPYSSHSNRAWHFLGEVGIAFLDEIEDADDWIWFSMNVFRNVYPVWSDEDGGWHEGVSYWSSYINRFTWWADVMRASMDINAYDKPYFSQAGYFAMYLMPPGKVGGGFGDGATRRKASQLVPLMSQLAAQAGNAHWQWYVDQMGGARPTGGYIGFVRGMLPEVAAEAPADLPTSRLFKGIGQAALNTTLLDAEQDVQVIFKSSPMGTRSHGNAANNSFVLWAYGQRLLTRTGHYYMYGGPHHRDWVWSTRSLNNITVSGYEQVKRSSDALGRTVDFATTAVLDGVVGEAAEAYVDDSGQSPLERYTRTVVFVKPELVIVYDRLLAREPASYEYWLHSSEKFAIDEPSNMQVTVDDVVCDIAALVPADLTYAQTNQYDPNPWPEIKTREWHVTAKTDSAERQREFLFLYRPHRANQVVPLDAKAQRLPSGYLLEAAVTDGKVVALLPTDDQQPLSYGGMSVTGQVLVQRRSSKDQPVETIRLNLQ